VSFVNHYTPSI